MVDGHREWESQLGSPVLPVNNHIMKEILAEKALLLMAYPMNNQLTFDQLCDAQSMFAAIFKARFREDMKQQEDTKSSVETTALKACYLDKQTDFDTMGWIDFVPTISKLLKEVKKSAGDQAMMIKSLAFLTTSGASSTNNTNTVNPEVSTAKPKDAHNAVKYVDDIIFGSTKKELCDEFEKLMKDKFQMSSMGELTFFLGLQVQQKKKGIFISQDKYVHEILRKYNYTDVKSASTPTDLEKPLVQDGDAADVDEHLYRSMIGSLMYLTASRPDIMFAVCACARFQVSPKTSHLLAVKRIFRYLKGKPSLGLWYSKDSPLELVAYTDSDYAGATQDRKSTTRGCQFLGNRLISWQCKKQTVVATSTTEAEYVAAASCCGQVLWIQNQLLDYGYNFMNTVIYIDNTSTICIIENPVQHSKTKHIEIRHHFIRDCNAKKLIQMAKIDTQHNVADLLTKGFDAGRFQYLVSSIGMLNP
ncbi:putative ribonuclease H-like domain-containing protein [Tanacetum coccineum]